VTAQLIVVITRTDISALGAAVKAWSSLKRRSNLKNSFAIPTFALVGWNRSAGARIIDLASLIECQLDFSESHRHSLACRNAPGIRAFSQAKRCTG
jgi:hypothetical protein